ncbi:MAG: response regulator [Candidatus Dadabacteria bacterium]|nr:MAG: response regulator [Candidatus Dadabacteria bacterium]
METQGLKLEELLEFLNSLRCPLFITDAKLKPLFTNNALVKFLGYKPGQLPDNFWPVANREALSEDAVIRLLSSSGKPVESEAEIINLDNRFYFIRLLHHDITASGHDSFHSERLETLGMLAGGIAHDFNNVLAGILGHITYLKTVLPATGAHTESLSAIEDGARKASLMTQRILNFSKLEAEEKATQIELVELMSKTCKLLKGAISPRYQFRFNCELEKLYVVGVEAKLAQVLVNLVVNARDAIKESGSIDVVLEKIDDPNQLDEVFAGQDLSASAYARIRVIDTGEGIAKEDLKRVFDRYYSTKKDKGTGLGLSTVKEIVQSHGGTVSVESIPGQGTTFEVYLPLSGADHEIPVVKSEEKKDGVLVGGGERILVVDDEYPVRNVLSVSLQHLGYQVDVAANGEEALELVRSEGRIYDLIIVDMLMPKLSGEGLFYELKKHFDNLPVLLISGFTSEESVQRILKDGGKGFLQKPFTIDELSRAVRESLDS